MVPETMGRRHFGVYIVITAVATFVFAYCVKSILSTMSSVSTIMLEFSWHRFPMSVQDGLIKASEATQVWYNEQRARYENQQRQWKLRNYQIRQEYRAMHEMRRWLRDS